MVGLVSNSLFGDRGDVRALVAVAAAGWSGMVLDPVRLSGRPVRPVVEVLPAGRDRVLAGLGPELDRSTLAMWESWLGDVGVAPPGAPVRIVGFVLIGGWRRAVVTAAWLAGYGPSLLVRRSMPTAVHLSEADYLGITVTVVGEDLSAEVAVRGRSGPVASAERTVAVRHREEILFAAVISRLRTTWIGDYGAYWDTMTASAKDPSGVGG